MVGETLKPFPKFQNEIKTKDVSKTEVEFSKYNFDSNNCLTNLSNQFHLLVVSFYSLPRSSIKVTLNTSPDISSWGFTTSASNLPQSRTSIPQKTCTPWKSLVYIKTHKTGSTTLQTVVNRFGFFNNLSFVFNRRLPRNGHFYFLPFTRQSPRLYFLPPLNVRAGDYKKYKNYDMLAVHVRYNRDAMDKFMRSGTKYISILREPSAQWESAFEQFAFQEAFETDANVSSADWIGYFLTKPAYYQGVLSTLSWEGEIGKRYHYARNCQIYDLGLGPDKLFDNETIVNETIKRLEKEFTLILIMEYFDESLLVLKRELCWEYEDIVYFPKNQRIRRRNLTNEQRQKIKDWNHADVLLYRYFNDTLWRKIKQYGPGFDADLDHFRGLKSKLFLDCGNVKPVLSQQGKRPNKHVEFGPKINSTLFCQTIAEHKRKLFLRVYNRQKPQKKIQIPKTKSKTQEAKNQIQLILKGLTDNRNRKIIVHKVFTNLTTGVRPVTRGRSVGSLI